MARPRKDLYSLCPELHAHVANTLAQFEDYLFLTVQQQRRNEKLVKSSVALIQGKIANKGNKTICKTEEDRNNSCNYTLCRFSWVSYRQP